MQLLELCGRSGAVRAALAVLALLLAAGAGQTQTPPADVTGLWIDHTGQGAVEIAQCGARICGRVVWLKNPEHRSKSGKRICGTQVLGDLRRRPNSAWEDGWIYNPEDEERFSAALKLAERQHSHRHWATSASSCWARPSPGGGRPRRSIAAHRPIGRASLRVASLISCVIPLPRWR